MGWFIVVWLALSFAALGMIVVLARGTARLRAMNRSHERRRDGRNVAGDMRARR